MMILNLSYADYCDAGKPCGKQGYPKWIHEEYNKRIADLEASLVEWMRDHSELSKSSCQVRAERDQLTKELHQAKAEWYEEKKRALGLEASLAAEKDEVDLKSACIMGLSSQCDKLAAQLETARKALETISIGEYKCTLFDPCEAMALATKALAQLSNPALSTSSGQADSKDILEEWDRVVADVLRERKRQDEQWGGPEHDDTHSWHDWIRYIQYQVSKGCISARRREGLVKIAALAIAGIESHDRKF